MIVRWLTIDWTGFGSTLGPPSVLHQAGRIIKSLYGPAIRAELMRSTPLWVQGLK